VNDGLMGGPVKILQYIESFRFKPIRLGHMRHSP